MMRSVLLLCVATRAAAAPSAAPTSHADAPDFTYDASAPLDVRDDGPAERWDSVAIQRLTYASPRGGRVPALLVAPVSSTGRHPAVVLQHGMGQLDKTELLPDAVLLARAGALAILVDAPDQRPASLRTIDYADHAHDRALWENATVDLRRAIDVLASRPDVDPARIGFVGHSFGASQGAILGAIEPRVRAVVMIGPGDFTRGIRTGSSESLVALRSQVPRPALDDYLARMAVFDASRYLSRAPASVAVLLQCGAYDANSSREADAELAAASTARTTSKRYPAGHFVTSIAAARDRLRFLAAALRLAPAGVERALSS
jgi:cephalosporin-C deacetylase-like acetyl esterase